MIHSRFSGSVGKHSLKLNKAMTGTCDVVQYYNYATVQ